MARTWHKAPTVCFDMDHVIATGSVLEVYSEEAGWDYAKCTPVEETVRLMNDLREAGVYLVIHTARWEEDREVTEEWLREHEVPYDNLVMGKPSADLYIDDRNYPAPYLAPQMTATVSDIMHAVKRSRARRK